MNTDFECPYCEKRYGDVWELVSKDGEQYVFTCDNCDKNFLITCSISVNYNTAKLCFENKQDHNWNSPISNDNRFRHCKECGKCEILVEGEYK